MSLGHWEEGGEVGPGSNANTSVVVGGEERHLFLVGCDFFFGVLLKMEKVIFVSTHGAFSPPPRQTPKLSRKGKPQEGWVGAKAGAAMATKE